MSFLNYAKYYEFIVIRYFSLQPRNYPSCFNDHNYFVKDGAGYILHRVKELSKFLASFLGIVAY